MNKPKTLNRKYKYKEEFEFLKKAKDFFGLRSKEVRQPVEQSVEQEPPVFSKQDLDEIRKKVSSLIFTTSSALKFYDIPLIYYNFYGLQRYNHLYYTDDPYYSDRGNPVKGSHYFLNQLNRALTSQGHTEENLLTQSLAERIEGTMSFILSDITKLIDEGHIDLIKDNPDTSELFSLIKQHGKYKDKLDDLLNYNKQVIAKMEKSSGSSWSRELEEIKKLSESYNDESYLYRLFEEDEVPSTPVKRETPQVQSPDKLSDDDIDILGDELNVEQSSPEPEGVPSSSMGIEDILKTVSQWKNDFEKSSILDSFISGADVVENNTERETFQYLTDSQYSDFSKLIDAGRTIATMINDLSYDAEKLLGEIELSRKMMVSDKE